MMRKLFDMEIGRSTEPQKIDFDFGKIKIRKVWTVVDESVLFEDGKEKSVDSLNPKHWEGYFFEDYTHDWDTRKGNFYYYSRVGEIGDKFKVLVEYDEVTFVNTLSKPELIDTLNPYMESFRDRRVCFGCMSKYAFTMIVNALESLGIVWRCGGGEKVDFGSDTCIGYSLEGAGGLIVERASRMERDGKEIISFS